MASAQILLLVTGLVSADLALGQYNGYINPLFLPRGLRRSRVLNSDIGDLRDSSYLLTRGGLYQDFLRPPMGLVYRYDDNRRFQSPELLSGRNLGRLYNDQIRLRYPGVGLRTLDTGLALNRGAWLESGLDIGDTKLGGRDLDKRVLGYSGSGIGLGSSGIGLGSSGIGWGSSGLGLGSSGIGLGSSGIGLGSNGIGSDSSGVGLDSAAIGLDSSGLGLDTGLNSRSVGLGLDSVQGLERSQLLSTSSPSFSPL